MPTIIYKNAVGKRVPSQSSIKSNIGWGKDGLIYWANQKGLEGLTLDQARDSATVPGTIAHMLIECDLKLTKFPAGQYKDEDIKKAETAYLNYLEWRNQFQMEPIAIEENLVSERYQYGACPDLIARVKGEVCLVDWKTGRTYEDLFIQLFAYKLAWEENHPDLPITGGFHVLRIPKNEDVPSFHHSHWRTLPAAAEAAFFAAHTLHSCKPVLKAIL